MKWIFITNTTSGQGKTLREIENIERVMKKHQKEYQIIQTEYPGHAIDIAKSFYEKDDVCLVATGGDGTIFEVVNGVNPNVPIAILPTGSGNDFSRMIVDQNRNIEYLLEELLDYKIARIDICEIKLKDKTIRCANGTSMGIDADINIDAVKMIKNNKANKKTAYNLAILKHIFFPKPKKLSIQIDNQHFHVHTTLLAVMNGKYYGNGIIPTPDASAQDGFLDVCLVEKLSGLRLVNLLPRYKKGLHKGIKKVNFYQCKYIKIEAEEEMWAQADGENYRTDFMEISILEQEQLILLPKKSLILQ